jgi:hypothetical protein
MNLETHIQTKIVHTVLTERIAACRLVLQCKFQCCIE